MSRELEGRVAVVTGSAQNIGRQIAVKLARLGASVVTHAKSDREGAEETARLCREAGGEAATWVGDLTTPAGAEALIGTAVEHFGGVHILVNNAAIRGNDFVLDITHERWSEILRTNLDAPFLCAQRAAPHMQKAGWGRIVNIGGLAGHRGLPKRVHVATTKAGVVGMTKGLALDLAEFGITANCIVPGSVNTIRGAAAGAAPHIPHPTLIGREGEPNEVAHMVVSLCVPEAAYTTGQTIHVNGGGYLP